MDVPPQQAKEAKGEEEVGVCEELIEAGAEPRDRE